MMLQWSENAGLSPGRKCGSSLAGKPDSSWEPRSHPHHPGTRNAFSPPSSFGFLIMVGSTLVFQCHYYPIIMMIRIMI